MRTVSDHSFLFFFYFGAFSAVSTQAANGKLPAVANVDSQRRTPGQPAHTEEWYNIGRWLDKSNADDETNEKDFSIVGNLNSTSCCAENKVCRFDSSRRSQTPKVM